MLRQQYIKNTIGVWKFCLKFKIFNVGKVDKYIFIQNYSFTFEINEHQIVFKRFEACHIEWYVIQIVFILNNSKFDVNVHGKIILPKQMFLRWTLTKKFWNASHGMIFFWNEKFSFTRFVLDVHWKQSFLVMKYFEKYCIYQGIFACIFF